MAEGATMTQSRTYEMMKCSLCDKFCDRSKIRQHLIEHFSGSDSHHICDKCGESFRASHLLRYHTATIHESPKFPCYSCDYKGYTKFTLRAHIDAVHTKDSRKKCDVCFESLTDQRSLIKHMMNKHDLEHKFKCDRCDKVFLTELRFSLHTEQVCEKIKAAKKEKLEQGKLKCDKCEFKADGPARLQYHTQAVHDKVYHNCDKCGYRNLWKYELNKHVKQVHGNVTKPLHPCGQCDYKASKLANLRTHTEAVHLKKREECGICGHTTSGKSTMRKHMISAHNSAKNKSKVTNSVKFESNDDKSVVQEGSIVSKFDD